MQSHREGPPRAVVLAVAHACDVEQGWPLITRLLDREAGLDMDITSQLDPAAGPRGVELWRM